ncbi:hypothetical protein NDU88_006185 [Pleurodeles waltl]|uniref:Uncharacterized protein n=1 Tax=Pleurodeles waltl TaxID=8319 RepID=A0AAV7X029_PLEWA|nr:hypothetical protein NDU88_006185 [Pleurodeles waltl]
MSSPTHSKKLSASRHKVGAAAVKTRQAPLAKAASSNPFLSLSHPVSTRCVYCLPFSCRERTNVPNCGQEEQEGGLAVCRRPRGQRLSRRLVIVPSSNCRTGAWGALGCGISRSGLFSSSVFHEHFRAESMFFSRWANASPTGKS